MGAAIAIGGFIILAAVLVLGACWLIDRDRSGAALFLERRARPLAGLCSCGAPLANPGRELEDFPADTDPEPEPVTEAVLPAVLPPPAHSPDWPMAAPVIEPAAVTAGPPPVPEAWIVAAATLRDGQVTSVQLAAGTDTAPAYFDTAAYVADRIRTGMGVPLPQWVTAELGHGSTEDAVESMWNRAQALELRAGLDGET
jgi:hypothetical protein